MAHQELDPEPDPDPDPHQHDADPQHCYNTLCNIYKIYIKIPFIPKKLSMTFNIKRHPIQCRYIYLIDTVMGHSIIFFIQS